MFKSGLCKECYMQSQKNDELNYIGGVGLNGATRLSRRNGCAWACSHVTEKNYKAGYCKSCYYHR